MKKYFFGFAALVLAIAFSAFTKPQKNLDTATFKYDASNGFAEAQVQDISNWVEDFDLCTDQSSPEDEQACLITVTDDRYFTRDGGGEAHLNATGNGTTILVMAINAEKVQEAAGPLLEYSKVVLSGTTGVTIGNINNRGISLPQ